MKKVMLTSFSYMHGGPPEIATRIIDCRPMRNPYQLGRLRSKSGLDQDVQDYVMSDPSYKRFVDETLAEAAREGHIAFGCIGGKHRSVAMVELTRKVLKEAGYEVDVKHYGLPEAA